MRHRKRRKYRTYRTTSTNRTEIKYRKSRRQKRKIIKTFLKRVTAVLLSILLMAATALLGVFLWQMHSKTVSSDISVFFQDNKMTITWNPSFEMDACILYQYNDKTKKYVSHGKYKNGIVVMEAVEAGKEMELKLQSVRHVKVLGRKMDIRGFMRKLTVNPREMTNVELQLAVDPQNRTAEVNWREHPGCIYEVYFIEDHGEPRLYGKTQDNHITLDFASDFALPDRSTPIEVAVRAVQQEEDYMLYSPISESVAVTRADLLDNELSLTWERLEEQQYLLRWEECRGSQYEVQQWSEETGRWVSKCTLDWTQDLAYTTDHLPSNTRVRFRVITYDKEEERDNEAFLTEPAEAMLHTGLSPLYCTIWPLVPLKVMDRPQGGETLGEVPAGQTLCVLEENSGCFKISYKDYEGYIDARFCLINLPEYIGDLCAYTIANSFDSIFRVHGYLIPGITHFVVPGYENIYLGEGDYLVPYLYPCSDKLYQAAINALEDGYKLHIYDAFRPNEATRFLYDTTESLLYEEVIEDIVEEDEDGDENGEEESGTETSPGAEEGAPDVILTDENGVPINPEELSEDEIPEVEYDTYWQVMTDGRFRLGSFLSAVTSTHNRGIALDLTLMDMNTREDLPMQSDMHDLSWYSIIALNNDNAKLLSKYMKGAGYNDLSSEWWHFQDDETRNALKLNGYLAKGVSIEGWKKDDKGWKYQMADGGFCKNGTVTIDGKAYEFDAKGYCERK